MMVVIPRKTIPIPPLFIVACSGTLQALVLSLSEGEPSGKYLESRYAVTIYYDAPVSVKLLIRPVQLLNYLRPGLERMQ